MDDTQRMALLSILMIWLPLGGMVWLSFRLKARDERRKAARRRQRRAARWRYRYRANSGGGDD